MPRFGEHMNNLRNQDKQPEPKLSNKNKEIADAERQIRVDSKVNNRITKLLK